MTRKKYLLSWTNLALNDLKDARDYITNENPQAARVLADKIRRRLGLLQKHPFSGRMVPEFEKEQYREVIVTPYRIVYMVRKENIIVLRVWHGRRDLKQSEL